MTTVGNKGGGMMADNKKAKDSKSGEILGPTYESGKPDAPLRWQQKLRTREEALQYKTEA